MRGLLVLGVAGLAALAPAAPASSGTDPDDHRGHVAPAHRTARPLPVPPPALPGPDEGCTVPVGTSLPACPPQRPSVLPESCVLPVGIPEGTLVIPDCVRPDRSPEGRVLPAPPATR